MNDEEREEWINNEESLYWWWQTQNQGITTFIRQHRQEIDRAIENIHTEYKRKHDAVGF